MGGWWDNPPPTHMRMVALKLQQFQCNPKKNFLRRLAFPMLFCQSPPPHGGGIAKGGGYHDQLILSVVQSPLPWGDRPDIRGGITRGLGGGGGGLQGSAAGTATPRRPPSVLLGAQETLKAE